MEDKELRHLLIEIRENLSNVDTRLSRVELRVGGLYYDHGLTDKVKEIGKELVELKEEIKNRDDFSKKLLKLMAE